MTKEFAERGTVRHGFSVFPAVHGGVGEPDRRASSVHPTQSDASKRAHDMGRRDGSEVIMHGRDGKIRESDSYGNDPFPPRDKK